MNQKALIGILIVVAVVLGAALAFTVGQRGAAPETMVPDEGQSQDMSTDMPPQSNEPAGNEPVGTGSADDGNDVPDGAVDPNEGLDQPIPPAPSLGAQGDSCLSNSDCSSGLYCAKSGSNACSASVAGTCETRPDVCAQVFAPVCGCDGETYSNSCGAASAGVNAASQGACN